MDVYFEVLQQVSTVRKTWAESVFRSAFEEKGRLELQSLRKFHPKEHFELVKVTLYVDGSVYEPVL